MDNVFSVDFSPAEGYLALGSHDRHVSLMAIPGLKWNSRV